MILFIGIIFLLLAAVGLYLRLSKRHILRLPPEWLEGDGDIEVIGRNKTQTKCTKDLPWDGKTLPVLHVDADFLEDFNDLLRCPNCGHQWSIGPDV
jgi:hypothetical protein